MSTHLSIHTAHTIGSADDRGGPTKTDTVGGADDNGSAVSSDITVVVVIVERTEPSELGEIF